MILVNIVSSSSCKKLNKKLLIEINGIKIILNTKPWYKVSYYKKSFMLGLHSQALVFQL